MADENRCPVCGGLRADDGPEGVCPGCEANDPLATRLHSSNPASKPVVADATGDWSSVPTGPTRAGSGGASNASLPPGLGTTVHYFGDYEIVRELGRGGMGVVYEARQVSLNRPVALKLIKAGLLADDDELRRFQNEAEAVALLDHPGIVAAYEVGAHEGQRYLAMKLVRGESLGNQLGRYQADPRAAVSLVAEAAEAVAHAHSRGVLHRDLKPANILVDAEGHPHITDFGLAKRLASDVEMTASGAILGTPAYMAPEQAIGRRGNITTATDVYGLGAVLYAVLTGKAPFGSDSVIETLDALRTRPPAPPTRLNANVPRDLETICLKAMEKDPNRRYASAQALADDLHAWLDSRPIAARRVSPAERAWLWCKRRPAVAALAAVAMLAVLGGAVATITVQATANNALRLQNQELNRAYLRESRSNAELAAANTRAEERYNLAMDAIKTFHTGVSEDFLLKEPQFQSLRDNLLHSAGAFYDRLGRVLESSKDAASRRALLASHYELAELEKKLGQRDEALALHRRVLDGREALAGEAGADVKTKVEAGKSLLAVVDCLKVNGLKSEVPPLLSRGAAYHEKLAADYPDDPDAQDALAKMLIVAGDQLKNVDGKRDEAEKAFRRSLAIREELVKRHPENREYRAALSDPFSYLSFLRVDEGKINEAIALYQKVLDIAKEEADRSPNDLVKRGNLAAAQRQMSTWYYALNRMEDVIAPARASMETWKSLIAAQPSVPGHRANLAGCHHTLGMALVQLNRLEEAEVELRAGLTLEEKIVAERPATRAQRASIANDHNTLGYLHIRQKRWADAEVQLRAGLAVQQQLVKEEPTDHDMRDSMAISHMNIGQVLSNSNLARSEAEFREAIKILAAIAEEQPAMVIYRQRLAITHSFLAETLRRAGRVREAETELRSAAVINEKIAAIDPRAGLPRNMLATSHNNLGDVLRDDHRPAEAHACYDRAIAIRERLVEDEPKTAVYRAHLAWSLRRRGLTHNALGNPAAAAADARKALTLLESLPTRSPAEWFETACIHASLAGLASQSASGVSAGAAEVEAETALQLLAKAIALGHPDAQTLRKEPAFDALRNRPEFQVLLMDLAMPADPFAP